MHYYINEGLGQEYMGLLEQSQPAGEGVTK